VEDGGQRRLLVGGDVHPAVRLLVFVSADVEGFDLEVPAHVDNDAEATLHRAGVDDVAVEFDGP
jgi:hypothetical protein